MDNYKIRRRQTSKKIGQDKGIGRENQEGRDMKKLIDVDSEIYDAIKKETEREMFTLELIASENFVSEAVLEAQGCVMTNKYAEGYPGKRYYGGCLSHGHPINFTGQMYKIVPYGVNKDTETIDYDEVLKLAREHKPKLIVVGASAYPRFIDYKRFREIADEVGAVIMADIAHPAGLVATGLHPTPLPYAEFVTTTTHKTLRGPRGGMVMCQEKFAKTLDKNLFPGIQGGPIMHVIAAKAVALKEALTPQFKIYQEQIQKNAKTMAKRLQERGFKLISGGTDNHLMLLDLRNSEITGKDAEEALDKAGITVNKNTVPFDPRSPFITSGIRIGTPAVTTRGMKEKEMMMIADLIADTINNLKD